MKINNSIVYTENFKKIITYYLFESPIEDTSARGELLSAMGWNGASRLAMLYRLMKEIAQIEDDSWISCKKNEVPKQATKFDSEYIHVVCNDDKGKAKSIIYSIRNAFAHGSFDVRECNGIVIYMMENHYKGKLRAEITLTEETLINWIKLFKMKPEYLTKKERKGKHIEISSDF